MAQKADEQIEAGLQTQELHFKPEKVLCVYHSRDLDGWTSAAIVKDYYSNATLIGWDYGQPVPEEMMELWDKIFLVDISFNYSYMKMLNGTNVIWIDHHASAIKDSIDHGYECMKGHRDVRFAACELTWDYIYPDSTIPEAVELLGLYDSFRHMKKDKRLQGRVTRFQYAARSYVDNPIDAQIFLVIRPDEVNHWVADGSAIHKYLTLEAKATVKEAFKVTINGHKGMMVNATRLNPKNFGIEIPDGEFFGAFHFNGKLWVTSLYSDTVDCSVICKELGGGGHPGAAGFQRDYHGELELIFNNKA